MHRNKPRFITSFFLSVCSLAIIFSIPAPALADGKGPSTWSSLETDATSLMEQEKFNEALAIIELSAPELPGYEFEISDLKLSILFGAGRADEAMAVWEKGLDEGYFYFIVPRFGTYDTVRKSERFKKNLALNNHLRDEANSISKPEFRVFKPASYSPEKSYALLMVIHGGNQSIVKAMETWDSKVLGTDLIIAYLQSSQRADTKSYRWDLGGASIYSLPTAQDEILGLYQTIVRDYSVDLEQVSLAGFSQGGNLALIMATEGTIPARGFIAGCPAIRTPLSLESAQAAASRGLRGTIFVGAEDWTAEAVQATVTNFNEAGLPVNHMIMEGKGHEYPDNFEDVLAQAVKHIYQ